MAGCCEQQRYTVTLVEKIYVISICPQLAHVIAYKIQEEKIEYHQKRNIFAAAKSLYRVCLMCADTV